MPSFEEYIKEIEPLFESKWLTNMGAKHNEFKQKLEDYLCVKHAELFCNGHLALEASLQALELTGEVITTPFTFISTTHAIVRNGLTPVFCDIKENDYTIDPDKIEGLITENTSAIVPVHVYGNICDVKKIEQLANRYNLKVVYDAAHAFAEEYEGKSVAAFGDASMFSFHATKVFNSIEGGCACFNDDALAEKARAIRNFGMYTQQDVLEIGTNGKMNEFSAAMGICNLRHLEEEMEKRRKVVYRYQQNLKGKAGITLWSEQNNVKHSYSYFPVLFEQGGFGKSRDEVEQILQKNGIYARKYFYPLTSGAGCYSEKYENSSTPLARHVANNILTLPLYADLSVEDVDRICKLILE